jgi:striatin 1/3/4
MNPLPNRPLLNNPNVPLSLPNVPSFEMAFNGRPRKVMPEVGKDFPNLNGMSTLLSGPPSAPASTASQGNPLDRASILGSTLLQPQHQQQQPPLGTLQPPPPELSQPPAQSQPEVNKASEATGQPGSLTAIFRPDEEGEWKEKLRLAHEASEQARAAQAGGSGISGAASWERRSREEEEESKPEEEQEVEEEEGTDIGEGEGGKMWKAKRTLRKSVSSS